MPARILIADDHPQTASACRQALADEGFAAAISSTASEVETWLRQGGQAVLLNPRLLGQRATSFCASLRAAEQAPDLILLVPPRMPAADLEPLRPFAAACLFKPFAVADLTALLRRVLDARPAPYAAASTAARGVVKERPVSPSDPHPGTVLAGCRLQRPLGRGAGGVVWLAQHLVLDLPVALKLLPAAADWDTAARERFLRGARAAARVSHPRVAALLNAGEDDGFLFLIQRYVEGETLKSRLDRVGRIPWREAVLLLRDIAEALAACHRLDVIHRDVKPGNIMLSAAGAVLVDFGLARAPALAEITSASEIVGTPWYMSPEQAQGRPPEPASDLYSLGATAYHALTARLPAPGDDPLTVLRHHTDSTPPPPQAVVPDLPPALSALIMKLLEKDPAKRHASADELAADVNRIAQTPLPPEAC